MMEHLIHQPLRGSAMALALFTLGTAAALAAPGQAISQDKQRVFEHWTSQRMAAAQPREFRIDAQGQAYLRRPDGSLRPYGQTAAGQQLFSQPAPNAKPGGGGGGGDTGDTTPPSISSLDPAEGAVIGDSYTFSAVITDPSGIKSVSFVVTYPDGNTTQSFSPSFTGNDTWAITLQGFSDGNWAWQVVAKDKGAKGGNTGSSNLLGFTVDVGGGGSNGGGDESHVISNAPWSAGGVVQYAAGRIYFEMPDNRNLRRWSGYVCSGTTASDGVSGRSIIITAAHCVYDDANKAFARNVLFIPNQDGTSGSGTDRDCSNDPVGCWTPDFGVVDVNWTTRTFPDNVEWDYAYYVVADSGAHSGSPSSSDALDMAITPMSISFVTPNVDDGTAAANSPDFTHGLGYSYSDDPNFMYCAEDMSSESPVNWWLASCDLSGGSSGGPWVQPMDSGSGDGPIMSVNSWGYTSSPGMAGPRLDVSSASCLFNEAKAVAFSSISSVDGDAGLVVDYCP